jgi:hypothetical protein
VDTELNPAVVEFMFYSNYLYRLVLGMMFSRIIFDRNALHFLLCGQLATFSGVFQF